MTKKAKKVEKLPPYIIRFRKLFGRYQLNYAIVVCLWIAAVIAIGNFINFFWCAIALSFGIWSLAWYEDGAHENCIDEWDDAYPQDGFRRMFNSWPWFLCIAFIAYICCKRWMPELWG